jgi:C-terminal processing protease CtpA/Prc
MFHDYKVGKIIGEPTGGLATTYSQRFDLSLPNTKINASVSCIKFYRPIVEYVTDTISPDIEISNTLDDCINNNDRQLQMTINLIKNSNSEIPEDSEQ